MTPLVWILIIGKIKIFKLPQIEDNMTNWLEEEEEEPPYSRHTPMASKVKINSSQKDSSQKYFVQKLVCFSLIFLVMLIIYMAEGFFKNSNEEISKLEPILVFKDYMVSLNSYLSGSDILNHDTLSVQLGNSEYLIVESFKGGRFKEIKLFLKKESNHYYLSDELDLFGEEGSYLSTFPINFNFNSAQFYSPPITRISVSCDYDYKEYISIKNHNFFITAEGKKDELLDCLNKFCNSSNFGPLKNGNDQGERKYVLNLLTDLYLLTRDFQVVEEVFHYSNCDFPNKSILFNEMKDHIIENTRAN